MYGLGASGRQLEIRNVLKRNRIVTEDYLIEFIPDLSGTSHTKRRQEPQTYSSEVGQKACSKF